MTMGNSCVTPASAILDLLYQSLVVTGELRTHMWATVGRLITRVRVISF
jgi:hypothetical protein